MQDKFEVAARTPFILLQLIMARPTQYAWYVNDHALLFNIFETSFSHFVALSIPPDTDFVCNQFAHLRQIMLVKLLKPPSHVATLLFIEVENKSVFTVHFFLLANNVFAVNLMVRRKASSGTIDCNSVVVTHPTTDFEK